MGTQRYTLHMQSLSGAGHSAGGAEIVEVVLMGKSKYFSLYYQNILHVKIYVFGQIIFEGQFVS